MIYLILNIRMTWIELFDFNWIALNWNRFELSEIYLNAENEWVERFDHAKINE